MTGLASAYTTHIVHSPPDRYIPAACHQVGCLRYRYGWDTAVDPTTELGQLQIQLVLSGAHGRTYRDLGVNAAGLRVFRFEPHQRCFEEHRTRPELYVVRDTALSGVDLGLIRNHTRPDDFVEDYRETLDRRFTSRERG